MINFSNISEVWTVRLKIIESCNWSCDFCHNEWDIDAWVLEWTTELRDALVKFRDSLNVYEIHLTWWEPSLNKNIWDIVTWARQLWMKVKMTTNWQFSENVRDALVDSGIDAVNFSLQSLDPDLLIQMMTKTKDVEWAKWQIDSAKSNIRNLHSQGIKVRVNAVLWWIKDLERVKGVMNWAIPTWIEMRVLDDLLNKEASARAIETLIWSYNAKLSRTIFTPWTSSSRKIYEMQDWNWEFTVKHIEQVYLPDLCEWCAHFWSNTCNEWFYNIRMQKDRKTWKFIVVLCIQNINQESVVDSETFLSHYHNKKYEVPTISRWSWSIQGKRIIPIGRI